MLFREPCVLGGMGKDSKVVISQERLGELFEEIRDRLEELAEKLDHLIDHLPSQDYAHHAYDSNLDDN